MRHERTGKVVALLLVALMVVSAAGGGALAVAPEIDTETSDTATESELQDESVVDGFNANDDNESTITAFHINGTSPDLEVSRNDSDTLVYENGSFANVSSGGFDATNDHNTSWNVTFSHDELADMEHTINENVTVDFEVINGSNSSESTTIQVHFNATDERTVENIDDVDADEDTTGAPVDVEEVSDDLTTITSFGIHELDFSSLDIDDRAVNGDETDVIIVLANDSVADHAADAVPSDVADADPLYGMTLVLSADDGPTQPIRVYSEEEADGIDDDDDTYAVYKDGGIGGQDGIEINLGEEYEDADDVTVTGTLNAGLVDRLVHRATTNSLWRSSVGVFSSIFVDFGLDFGGGDGGGLAAVAPLLACSPAARRRALAR